MPRGYPTQIKMSIPVGGGRVTVRRRRYHNLEQTVHEAIQQEGDQFGRDIVKLIRPGPSVSSPGQSGWPVDSGRSQAAWGVRLRTGGRTLFVEIINRYLYTVFVERGTSRITPRRIILGIWRRNRRFILNEFEREISRRIQRRVDRAGRRGR